MTVKFEGDYSEDLGEGFLCSVGSDILSTSSYHRRGTDVCYESKEPTGD